ncbi:MAG: GNAT family N-acetyltransferase [Treponema sp.]|nr:GNAT family N-acetyltransferase [Treponema sp.]
MDNRCIIVLEDIKFFPVSTEDIQYGYDLWKLTQKEFLEKINGEWNDEFELNNYKDERIRNLENNYIIKFKENIVGWLEYELFNDYIYINQLHITPEYQNKGIGTKILNEYIVYGKKENKNIYLEVLQGNERALEYYKKIGFKEYDECSISKTLVYEINGVNQNDHI